MRRSILLLVAAAFVGTAILLAVLDSQQLRENARAYGETKDPKRPAESEWIKRTFPHFDAAPSAVAEMIGQAQAHRARPKSHSADYGAWEFAGPTNIGGRITDIEFNPSDGNTVYAGAATGGVFKSTDKGNTWASIFDDQAALSCGDIAVDPNSTQVLYVGTGEANGGHNNFPGGGVYKSTDGGTSWTLKGLETTASIGRVAVDPANSNRIFVGAVGSYFSPAPERGLYLSEDGGETWDLSLFVSDSTGCVDVAVDPSDPSVVFAAMWERVRRPNSSHLFGPTGGLFRSQDGGDTWIELTGGLPDPDSEQIGRIGISIHESDPSIVYALYNDGADYVGLYRSNDGGDSWIDADPAKRLDDGTAGFSWYFGQVRVHPNDPDIVYALDVAFSRSTNGGSSWPIMYGYGGPPILHVDHHALAFHPEDPSYLVEGNDGGINISTNGGQSWSKVASLPVTQFYEIGLDTQRPDRLYGGTQDNGTLRTVAGAIDDWEAIYGGDGFYVNVNPEDYREIYAESQFGFLGKTTNDAASWSYGVLTGINPSESTNWSTPVVIAPSDGNTLYYGTDRVYRSTNGAGVWSAISDDLTDGLPDTRLGTVTTIAVAPTNAGVIWAGTDDAHVWVTTDGGGIWSDVSSTLPTRWVTRIAVDPIDDQVAYVAFSGLKWHDPEPHIFKTTDSGENWSDISDNLPSIPINALAIDNQDPDVIFVGTDAGAWVSTFGGGQWEVLGSGLPLVSIYDLKVHPTERFLVAGTHGRSMYKLALPEGVNVEEREEATVAGPMIRLHPGAPNPFNPSTTIRFTLSEAGAVRLTVYDAAGRKVRMLLDERRAAGEYASRWDGKDDAGRGVASGRYLVVLEALGRRETGSLVLVE
ncbi:MAG: hypothetical protein CME06_11770 [Gemmatimonadetes bacterium]|nr:hypothetical protein [Gemmatimonadota bacterium]